MSNPDAHDLELKRLQAEYMQHLVWEYRHELKHALRDQVETDSNVSKGGDYAEGFRDAIDRAIAIIDAPLPNPPIRLGGDQ